MAVPGLGIISGLGSAPGLRVGLGMGFNFDLFLGLGLSPHWALGVCLDLSSAVGPHAAPGPGGHRPSLRAGRGPFKGSACAPGRWRRAGPRVREPRWRRPEGPWRGWCGGCSAGAWPGRRGRRAPTGCGTPRRPPRCSSTRGRRPSARTACSCGASATRAPWASPAS